MGKGPRSRQGACDDLQHSLLGTSQPNRERDRAPHLMGGESTSSPEGLLCNTEA